MGQAKSAMSRFTLTVNDLGVEITEKPVSKGWLGKLFDNKKVTDLSRLPRDDEHMLDAFAELRELGESGGVQIEANRLALSHDVLARISDNTASLLELPPAVELTLKMEMDGQLGSQSFALRTQWLDSGRVVVVQRTGAYLKTERGPRRVPAPLLRAVEEAERVTEGPADLSRHWERLALFRNALEPDAADPETLPDFAQQCAMNSFLEGLKLRACSSMSIGKAENDDDFSPIPFTSRDPEQKDQETEEAQGLISGAELSSFQRDFRKRGATPAYRLADGEFLILTPGVMPLAELMSRKQHAPGEERRAFLLNPEPSVRDAYRQARRDSAEFDEAEEVMGAAELEALDEAAVDDRLVITIEYRDRVIDMGQFEAPDLSMYGAGPANSSWMPESVTEFVRKLQESSNEELEGLRAKAEQAQANASPATANPTVDLHGTSVPAGQAIEAIEAEQEKRRTEEEKRQSKENETEDDVEPTGSIVLITETNFDAVDWHPETQPRLLSLGDCSVPNVQSTLMSHQESSLDWAQRAWAFGMPGILNADEQGLGKTLQTLAFLSWLHTRMEQMPIELRRPFLIVAPTSLLRNWEAEIELHLHASRFANVTQLYGSQLGKLRGKGAGTDVQSGEAMLDLAWLETACKEGRGHNHILLTTYRTATNYHHSLHRIPFAALVFDEIQNLKNPGTLSATACRSLQADFRMGLTGTPIENKVQDLWAIMDQISPGSFSSLKDFSGQFGSGDRESLELLNQRLLDPFEARPPIGIRRLKEHVVAELPPKQRILLPALMPESQAECYDAARVKLASSTRGGALKALHHIRSVSAHPGLVVTDASGDNLTTDSARLQQVMAALDWIKARGERALVFVEAKKLQYRLAEYLAVRYELDSVDVINGSTSIPNRQKIVQRFQSHLERDGGFDALVLGPRAAGTGLTLTAANHVLHVSRWWNPAVEEQCNDRVHRIGQHRNVTVHLPLAIHPEHGPASFDCLLQQLMLRKRTLATDVLAPVGEAEGDTLEIQGGLQSTSGPDLPRFESPEVFQEWVEKRLDEYLLGLSRSPANAEKANVVVTLHHPDRQTTAATNVDGARVIALHADNRSRLHTEHATDGSLTIVLGGSMLNLWPQAILETCDVVELMG